MPDKRMISRKLITDDPFLDMPFSARALYFTFVACADDDGFVNGPRSIIRQIGAAQADMDTLVSNHYLILFNSGVVVIRHWRMQNSIPKDRYHPTLFQDEMKQLMVDKNGVYFEKPLNKPVSEDDNKLYTECIQDDNKTYTEDKLSKDRLSEDKVGEVNIDIGLNPSVYDCFPSNSVELNKELSTLYTKPIPIRREGYT